MIEIVEIAFVENIALTVVDELMTSLEDEHSGLTLKGVRGGLPPVIVPPSELVPLSGGPFLKRRERRLRTGPRRRYSDSSREDETY